MEQKRIEENSGKANFESHKEIDQKLAKYELKKSGSQDKTTPLLPRGSLALCHHNQPSKFCSKCRKEGILSSPPSSPPPIPSKNDVPTHDSSPLEPAQTTSKTISNGVSAAHHMRSRASHTLPTIGSPVIPLKVSIPLTAPPSKAPPLPPIQTNLCSHGESLTLCSTCNAVDSTSRPRSSAVVPVNVSTSKASLFCTNCGKERIPGTPLCPHCNVKFEDYSGVSTIETGTQTPKGGKVTELWSNPSRSLSPRSGLRNHPFRTTPSTSSSQSSTPSPPTTPSPSINARLAFFASGRK